MKALFLSMLIALIFPFESMAQKPEPVISFVYEDHPCEWYQTQAKLWKKETQKDPKNSLAWMYYYKATRYTAYICASEQYHPDWEAMKKELDAILDEMKKKVPNSYEYNYLVFYNNGWGWGPENVPYLEKAYTIDPNRTEAYPDLVVLYETRGDSQMTKEILTKWQQLSPASPGVLSWNYNVMATLEPNAIVLTGGDNDTYPKWIMQYVMGIRPDVCVINMSLIMLEAYRNRLFKDAGIAPFTTQIDSSNYQNFSALICEHIAKNSGNRPVYVSLSVGENNYSLVKDSLYLEGMVYKYSPERYDNIAVLRKNYEKVMLLDYIKVPLTNDISQPIVNNMNLNYIAPFLQLYDHYNLSGEIEKANQLADLVRLIASRADNKQYMDYVEEYLKRD